MGELLTKEDAKDRHKSGHNDNYILHARENFQKEESFTTIIDARYKGNAARFANHSCQPNAQLIPIHIDNEYPRIGLFAIWDIREGVTQIVVLFIKKNRPFQIWFTIRTIPE